MSIRHPAFQPDADRRDAALLHEDRRREGGRSLEILKERGELKEDAETLALIREKLPSMHRGYTDVFSKLESDRLPPHRIYNHRIQLEAPLLNAFSPLYQQGTEELRATKQYLIENLEKGFIENSNSPFASPILFVKKADSKLRFYIDYRKLNGLTCNDPYPILRIDELLRQVSKARIFTKLDIRQAFHRIRVHPDSKEYTTFRTRYGSYKCKVLPFRLTNGPTTYQRYMNDVLIQYLDDFYTAYLDDILIYSEDPTKHIEHIHKVLQRLQEAGLQANIKKCEFNVTCTKYLGYILTTTSVEADPEKIEPLRNWTRPTTVTGEIHDKELFAIVKAFQKWRPELNSVQHRVEVYTDHRSLEYFMSTKVLTAKQVRKNNQKADILSRREQDLVTQQKVKLDSQARVLLGLARLNHCISAELADSYIALINALEAPASQMPFELIEALCANNRKTFTNTRAKTPLLEGFSLKDQLLLYKDRLYVNRNTELCTRLI
ncbi:hypothetical protein V496_00074 [Pseudogymnoascus sp. VKM F-4515 (FW-2607)]|nr:hypothetical protein V496_00074 [Pseudogymnoascus sp. VKM F-4515 (FW-2607)]